MTQTTPSAIASITSDDAAFASRARMALWIVQIGVLLGLVWKWRFFKYSYGLYQTIPLDDSFFPFFFRSPHVLAAAYVAVVASLIAALFLHRRWLLVSVHVVALSGLTITCLHQGSYNDATFTTSWWTSLWMLWVATRIEIESPDRLLSKAAFLSRLIVSMILLGGAVGKWTPEYWSGDVLHDIYFVDRPHWTFHLLRESFTAETNRMIAIFYSRFAIITETVCGLGLWLLPPRVAAVLGILVFSGIAVLSNWYLFSVLLAPIVLAAVGLFHTHSSDPTT